MNRGLTATRAALAAIIALALLLRLYQVGFGLPGLYDPDEPLFMVKAAGLLTGRTLDPHWFGHPGSTTIYLTALIQALVFIAGWIGGRFANVADFVHAAYADPAIVFVPVRIAMALLGTACVALTYALGKQLYGKPASLLAALLLALNSLHIAWSQVVRTDVQASAFMLAALVVASRPGEGLFDTFSEESGFPLLASTTPMLSPASFRSLARTVLVTSTRSMPS